MPSLPHVSSLSSFVLALSSISRLSFLKHCSLLCSRHSFPTFFSFFIHSFSCPVIRSIYRHSLTHKMPSIAFLALAAVPLLSKYAYADCAPVPDIKLTAYGFADGNSATTSFGCSGSNPVASGSAGGSGSYDDPFTLATAAGSSLLKECELIYVPYYKKYYRFQDHCSGCGKFDAFAFAL